MTWSKKRYRTYPNNFIETEYSPLLGGFESEEERSNSTTPWHSPTHPEGVSRLGFVKNQGFFGIPHPSTPLIAHPPPHNSRTPPPPPLPPNPLRRKIIYDIKLPIFGGLGSEDPHQLWFVANSIWTSREITSDDLKKAQLVTTLQERALT